MTHAANLRLGTRIKKRRHGLASIPAPSNQRHQGLVCRCLHLCARSLGLRTMCKG